MKKLLIALFLLLSTTANAATLNVTSYANLPAAVAAASSGDQIYLPTGTYHLTSQLVLDCIALKGDGPSSIIKLDAANFDGILLKHCVDLRDLSIIGSATSGATGNFGLTTPYPADSTSVKYGVIDNVTISDMASAQMKLNEGTENVLIDHYTGKGFHGTSGVGWGYGILAGPVKNVHVQNSVFCGGRSTGDGRHALYFAAVARDVWLENNKMKEFMQQAISIDSRSTSPWNERIHIFGNTILNSGDIYAGGIGVFAKSKNLFIDDNYISGGAGNGIHIEGTSADGSPSNIQAKQNILAGYTTAFWTGVDGGASSLTNVSTDNLTPSTGADSEDDFCGATSEEESNTGIVWQATLSNQAGGYTGYTSRETFPISALTVPTGTPTKFRVTYKFGTSAGGTLDAVYLGHRSGTTGHTYNGTPVQVTFGGSTSVSGAAGAEVVSDWMTFSYNKTDGLIFGEHMSAGGYKATNNSTTATLNVKASINEPGAVTPTSGYTTAAGYAQGIEKIEMDGF